ncbi:alpha/beta hydrolase family protein [Duganella sp. P38]|uniref:alpha/beta hydrolase family protein n=1 Tax=Duganella sp. P38 TaxID=3423949 RepID=UPI003D78F5F6
MFKLKPILLTFLALCAVGAQAAGFQRAFAADPNGKPLAVGIWYPSQAATRPFTMGTTIMPVAPEAPIDGSALPMIVISHGTGGSMLDHHDTAIALADAGYVVAAVTHGGDNYADQRRATYIMDRPVQISRVIDYMRTSWGGGGVIDAGRIGMFGFSAGGFTTLVNIGGKPDFARMAPMCRLHPSDFACQLMAKAGDSIAAPDQRDVWDKRIRAAVVAAPALGFTLSPDGLNNVRIPVQLWRAEDDVVLPHPRYAEAVRQALPVAPDYHVVPNAGHFDFLAPCSDALAKIAPPICQSAAGFDRAAFHQTFNASVVRFFGENLN